MTQPGDRLTVSIDMPYGIYSGPAVVTAVYIDFSGVELATLTRPDGRIICNGYETGRHDIKRPGRPDPRFIDPANDGAATE